LKEGRFLHSLPFFLTAEMSDQQIERFNPTANKEITRCHDYDERRDNYFYKDWGTGQPLSSTWLAALSR